MYRQILTSAVGLMLYAVVLVSCNEQNDCEDIVDAEGYIIVKTDESPLYGKDLETFVNSQVVPCAKKLVAERDAEEKRSCENAIIDQQSPSAVVNAYGRSSRKVKWITVPACLQLCAKELIKTRWNINKLDLGALGVGLTVVSDTEIKCYELTGSRKKREVVSCLYNHGIDCNSADVYRTIDGSCNNLQYPAWGRANTPFDRLLEPDYADGIQSPKTSSQPNTNLPSARKVSLEISQNPPNLSPVHTFLHVTFGQMVDHDLTATAHTQVELNGTFVDVPCGDDGCNSTGPENTACFPIPIPEDDPNFSNQTCLKFIRTQEVLPGNCDAGPREQLNIITSWLDASHVYGSSHDENDELRDTSQPNRGMLKTTPHPENFKPLLPQRHDPTCRNINSDEGIRCFRAGDERVNDQVGLASLHTLFHRYHNFIEAELHRINPSWTGERKYQEARKILIAHWQNIVYNELVTNIIGPELVRDYNLGISRTGYRDVYNPAVNPAITNSFATAAYRFGHSQIAGNMMMMNKDKEMVKDVPLSMVLRDPNELYQVDTAGGNSQSMIDAIMQGHLVQQAETTDAFFDRQITFHLFTTTPSTGVGMDLLALNIQRGRDHGLPSYNKFRQFCGLEMYTSFETMDDIPEDVRDKLASIYDHVDDVELYTGGVSENHLPGAAVGPTFGCIIAMNFQRIMYGDRFWFETSDSNLGFTVAQLNSIKKATISSVFCAAGDNIDNIQKHILLRPRDTALTSLGSGKTLDDLYTFADNYRGEPNIEGSCNSIHQINFNLWRDKEVDADNRRITGRARDETITYDPATGLVTSGGRVYTAEQFEIKFSALMRAIIEGNSKLSEFFVSIDDVTVSSGSVVFDYVLEFTGDITLSDSEIQSEIAGDLGNYEEFGLIITFEDDDGLSTIEIVLIVLGCVAAVALLIILGCVCLWYYQTAAFGQPRRTPYSHFNHGMDPYHRRSFYGSHRPSPTDYHYPKQWKPERMGGAFYNSQQSLYGRTGY